MPPGIVMVNASKCFTSIALRNGQKRPKQTKTDKLDGDVLDANLYEKQRQENIYAFVENKSIHLLKEDARRHTVAARSVEKRLKHQPGLVFTNALSFVIRDLVHLVLPMLSSKCN